MCQLDSTSSSTVIDKTKSFFARHGIPETVVSDNGPNLVQKISSYLKQIMGFPMTSQARDTHKAMGLLNTLYKL